MLAAGGSLAAAALPSHLDGATAYKTVRLHANGPTAFAVGCRGQDIAVSGGVVKPAPEARLVSAKPLNARTFAFRFQNAGPAARVTVAVACRRSRAGGPALRATRLAKPLLVRGAGQTSGTIACPSQSVPAGFGVGLPAGDGSAVELRRATANTRGFEFTFANNSAKRRNVVVFGECLSPVSRPRAALEPLHFELLSFTQPLAPGLHRIRHTCRSGWLSLATGYALARPGLRVDGSAAVGASGTWLIDNTTSGAASTLVQLVCARLGA